MQVFRGKVVKGKSRGKDLGFPTANIAVHQKIEEGIYLGKSQTSKPKSQDLPSLIFIGSAKTFGEKDYKAEVYILDFKGDLYGKYITVHVLKKIRDNKKFDSQEELIEQMEKDLEVAKKFFAPWC
ncbi:MAG TPA: riboflavin kinase [Patescibacteria group bacterium]|nr:riboflavin kinase [Patescibacteria group bacterium]